MTANATVQTLDTLRTRLNHLHDGCGLSWRKIASQGEFSGIPPSTLHAIARAEAAEDDAAHWQSVHADNEAYALAKFREYKLELAALRAQLAAREWRAFVDEPDHLGRPENDQDCQVLVEASYIRSHYYGDDNEPGTWLAADYKVLDGVVLAWRPTPPGSDEDTP